METSGDDWESGGTETIPKLNEGKTEKGSLDMMQDAQRKHLAKEKDKNGMGRSNGTKQARRARTKTGRRTERQSQTCNKTLSAHTKRTH